MSILSSTATQQIPLQRINQRFPRIVSVDWTAPDTTRSPHDYCPDAMRIYMQTPVGEDAAPRYYHLHLQEDLLDGWTLVREWGRQGASGRIIKEHYPHREGAEIALLKVRDEQIKRGYRVVFIQGLEQP